MQISIEKQQDMSAIRKVHEDAFETSAEAEIVEKLRASGDMVLSLVGTIGKEVVGHIAFSKMNHPETAGKANLIGLGTVAVKTRHQGFGIGSKLISRGLETLQLQGYGAVFVLGHPDYYPRFGFQPSRSVFNIWSRYDVPDNVFLATELQEGALKCLNGLISYSQAFD